VKSRKIRESIQSAAEIRAAFDSGCEKLIQAAEPACPLAFAAKLG